jgi:hypothetical protein
MVRQSFCFFAFAVFLAILNHVEKTEMVISYDLSCAAKTHDFYWFRRNELYGCIFNLYDGNQQLKKR